MPGNVILQAPIAADLDARLTRLAELTGHGKPWHVAQALERYLEHELALALAVAEGIAEAERGELIPHEEVMGELESRFGRDPVPGTCR